MVSEQPDNTESSARVGVILGVVSAISFLLAASLFLFWASKVE